MATNLGTGEAELLGREVECRLIDELLERAAAETSGVLVLRGEAGIGKSTLLHYARRRAHDAGFTVLGCRGLESESQLSYSGLADLLGPLNDRLDQLPDLQAAELAAALTLGPPAGGNRFAVAVGTLALLGLAAGSGPVLLTVDDLHALDRLSAEAITFAARRLDAEGVVALFSLRDEVHNPSWPTVDVNGLPELRLGGLTAEPGADLVLRSAHTAVAPAVARQLVGATAGNPLALVELSQRLSEDELSGRHPVDELALGTTLTQTLQQSIATLPPDTVRALLAVALSDLSDPNRILSALPTLEVSAASLEAAIDAGLLISGHQLRFRHPLLRAAVRRQCSASAIRETHLALAAVAADHGETERAVWHRAAALVGPDEETSESLATTAEQARGRGGPAAAARAYERAADLATRPERRFDLLLAAARESTNAGDYDWALRLLERTAGLAPDSASASEAVVMRAAIEQVSGSAETAHRLLSDLGRQIAPHDPRRAAVLLAGAALTAIQAGDLEPSIDEAATAVELAGPTATPIRAFCDGTRAVTGAFAGRLAEPSALLKVLADGNWQKLPQWPSLLPLAINAAICYQYEPAAITVLDQLISQSRIGNAIGRLPIYLSLRAEAHARIGRWNEAYSEAVEALTLARETNQNLTISVVTLARLEACRGQEANCLAHLDEAMAEAGRMGHAMAQFPREAARGLLHLGLGRAEQAILPLERLTREADRIGLDQPAIYCWLPDLVEAYVKAGRVADAAALMPRFERAAHTTGWSLSTAARCRGLLAADGSYETHFADALTHHGTQMPFERARTELCLGERLRRSRRRAAALPWLDAAADSFARLGAQPWYERAHAESALAGGPRPAPEPDAVQRLSPREWQIAILVARGATNREVASNLFLSDKTVEAHLTRIYRTLGLRSRAELAARMSDF
jgi:ATP/maltotriose-dependent transcriptional regulator MalT